MDTVSCIRNPTLIIKDILIALIIIDVIVYVLVHILIYVLVHILIRYSYQLIVIQ